MAKNPNPFADVAAGEERDQELVQLAKGGSRDALEELVVRHQAWIYNLALRMVHHPEDAEDATQEVLTKILTKLSTFDERSSLRTWLYRVAINHLLNKLVGRATTRVLVSSPGSLHLLDGRHEGGRHLRAISTGRQRSLIL